MMGCRAWAAYCGLAAIFASAGQIWAADPPPAEAYGHMPKLRDARLSADGTAIAAIADADGRPALVVHHLDGKDPTILTTGDLEPRWFIWKNDHRLIASLMFSTSARVLGVTDGETRLIAVDADGKNPKNIVKLKYDQRWISQSQDRIVDLLKDDPDHILLELDRHTPTQDNPFVVDVSRIDVNTGESHDILHGQRSIYGWMTDRSGAVRLGEALRGADQVLYVRDSADDSWRSLERVDANFGTPLHPLSFGTDPNSIFVEAAPSGNTWGVYEFDVSKATFGRQIVSYSNYDAAPLMQDGHFVGYFEPAPTPAKMRAVYLDPAWEHDIAAINHAVPDTRNIIIDRTADGTRELILSQGDNEPGAYYVLDRRAGKTTLNLIGSYYPDLDSDQILPVKQITYKSRDGLLIHAFLTLPKGAGARPIPFVVLPHGGPSAHDNGSFDVFAQFIASRGYGVLQPNFRGSTGYGPAFEQAGLKQWGLAMQDDVTDGVQWLINQKLADPRRLCVVGASYGGYVALMGAVKTPDLYRCAVSIAGISDLDRLVHQIGKYTEKERNLPRIVNGKLEDTSPVEHVDQIRIPIMLIHGRKDFTVYAEQSEEMERALKRADKPVEAIYFDDEDHSLSHGHNRTEILKAIERFLKQNLGPGYGG